MHLLICETSLEWPWLSQAALYYGQQAVSVIWLEINVVQ